MEFGSVFNRALGSPVGLGTDFDAFLHCSKSASVNAFAPHHVFRQLSINVGLTAFSSMNTSTSAFPMSLPRAIPCKLPSTLTLTPPFEQSKRSIVPFVAWPPFLLIPSVISDSSSSISDEGPPNLTCTLFAIAPAIVFASTGKTIFRTKEVVGDKVSKARDAFRKASDASLRCSSPSWKVDRKCSTVGEAYMATAYSFTKLFFLEPAPIR
mmetsp:Transcript_6042/g.8813  ORF Transcript_6042/g.8813 Transcript_6042/m.8813 type:complete len:210 (-) Transcript_6042:149-778(-)